MAESNANSASEATDRYAQAAFELALESIGLEALEKDFAILDSAFAESADLRLAARSPLIDSEEKVRALTAVAAKIGLSELAQKVVGVAARNGRAGELPALAEAYRARVAAYRGARTVEVVSAQPLAAEDLQTIIAALKAALGQEVQPKTRVDESLIGGFVVRAGSRQFDASVRTKLDSLKLALKAG